MKTKSVHRHTARSNTMDRIQDQEEEHLQLEDKVGRKAAWTACLFFRPITLLLQGGREIIMY